MSKLEDTRRRSLQLHEKHRGKIEIAVKVPLDDIDDLSLAYTPGVAAPCRAIEEEPARLRDLTVAGNAVAVVTDGSAVLGLGDIGPRAAMPVMEGKCALFKALAGVDAWPVCLDTEGPDAVVEAVRALAPGFAGVNLEDISAPECFEIEEKLQDLGIPVMHDDQHGTAIVMLGALINAMRVTDKEFPDLRIAMSGAGAAGKAIVQLLRAHGETDGGERVKEIVVCDSDGILHGGREDLDPAKRYIVENTNPEGRSGSLRDALEGANVFIGVSTGDLLKGEDIRRMEKDPIVFALANPTPEIMPDEASEADAAIVATGRSDFPNQVNNVLGFPGIFRGALDAKATKITERMKLAAARAIADSTEEPKADQLLEPALERKVARNVAEAVRKAAEEE